MREIERRLQQLEAAAADRGTLYVVWSGPETDAYLATLPANARVVVYRLAKDARTSGGGSHA